MMRMTIKLISAMSVCTFIFLAPAFALTVLKEDEARTYIGDPKARFLAGTYRYEILSRKFRDTMHGRFSDAVIFNSQGGLFGYPRRKDGDHRIVIDAPNGREEDPVTEDSWRQKIANTLSDDNTVPYVFLDDARTELAVIYVGKGTQVKGQLDPAGLLEIQVVVPGSQERQSSSRRRR